jgi:DNA-binding LacI/PurR family transcriptional regulator
MHEPPTALFFADPLLAIGALKKSHELGVRIPQDLSIVGFDDTDMRFSVHPTLTAVCQDARGLGYEAGTYLTSMLTSSTRLRFRKTAPTFFEIHDTTGAPPDKPKRLVSNGRPVPQVAIPTGESQRLVGEDHPRADDSATLGS